MRTPLTVAAVLGALALGAGCAHTQVPTEELANSKSAIRSAELAGAENVPPAALHLQYAREQMSWAQDMIQQGDSRRAALMLDRAESDAELALSLAREEPVRQDAQRVLNQVRSMQR